MDLQGKTVLLTGASKGLGRELARQLDAKGCRLLLVARDTVRLSILQKDFRTSDSQQFYCDLSSQESRAKLVEQILTSETHIDLLIHNAGIGSHSKLNKLTPEETQLVLSVNTIAPLELTAALLPLLPTNEPAGIVNIGSVAGELTMPGMSLYSASKTALHAFSRAANLELANGNHFCMLVVLGALHNTNFGDSIRNPANKQPGAYRKLDVDVDFVASKIINAIEQEISFLVIPKWYQPILALYKILFPLTQLVTKYFYQKYR